MINKFGQVLTGSGKDKRRSLDFYPTPKECTIALMDFFKLQKMKIWEPACGTGEISRILESYGHYVISTDLRHTGYGEGGIDYLTANELTVDAIITNPPFNISHLFIQRALKEAGFVAMILKSQYWHAKIRLPIFNSNKPAYILPMTWRPDFAMGTMGNNPTMDAMWCVWIKDNNSAIYQPIEKPKPKTLFS
jgi:hypothetical protein